MSEDKIVLKTIFPDRRFKKLLEKRRKIVKYIDEEERELIEFLKDLDVEAIESDKENIERLKKAAQDYMDKQDKNNNPKNIIKRL